jgi:uncharacterized protein (DUF952 family)
MTDGTARLFHLAVAGEWAAAVAAGGGYRTSTLGRSLDEEGFTHCARAGQVEGVLARFYAGVTDDLVVLEVDPARLTSPVVDEVPAGRREAFPHVYGEIDVGAVVALHPVPTDAAGRHAVPAAVSAASTPSAPSTAPARRPR